jgi:branched-chain amino acid aminotransferase
MNPPSLPGSFPVVYHCGRFLPADEATVSIFDRGLLYGDGLFETIRVQDDVPLRWHQHLDRLRQGADFLRIPPPQPPIALRHAAGQLIHLNQAPTSLLRVTVTRGVGPRGYSPRLATHPTTIMSLHPAPPVDPTTPNQWRLVTSKTRLSPDDPLTRFKTCNRLPYVLARYDADLAQADDAIILNTRGEVAETSSANIFWLQHGCLCTTPLDCGVLPGITRANVLRLAPELALPTLETAITPAGLFAADAVFLTVTSLGLIEAISLDHRPLARSPLVQSLHAAYCRLPDAGNSPATLTNQAD